MLKLLLVSWLLLVQLPAAPTGLRIEGQEVDEMSSLVQAAVVNGSTTGAVTAAFGSNITAGSRILAIGFVADVKTLTAGMMTDTLGNTYVLDRQITLPSFQGEVGFFSALSPSGGANTVTFDPSSGSTRHGICVREAGNTGAYEGSQSNNATNTSATTHVTGTITPAAANGIAIAHFYNNSDEANTWESDYATGAVFSATGRLSSAHKLISSTSSEEATLTSAFSFTSFGAIIRYPDASGGPTQYDQSVSGAITPAGVITKLTNRTLVGTVTITGVMLKQAQKLYVGMLMTAGVVLKQAQKIYAGTLTTAGALTSVKTALLSLVATLTSSGSLSKMTMPSYAGALTGAGALIKHTTKSYAGTLLSSGTLSTIRTILASMTATLTSSGSLIKSTAKFYLGSLTSSGTVSKHTAVSKTSTLVTQGSTSRLVMRMLTGSLTFAATVTAQTFTGIVGDALTTGYGFIRRVVTAQAVNIRRITTTNRGER